MSINSINYPGCYAQPVFVENHTNPQAAAFAEKVKDEIATKQAYVKVEFLKNTLEKYNKTLSNPERYTLEYMLRDAQRELAQIQQNLRTKYPA